MIILNLMLATPKIIPSLNGRRHYIKYPHPRCVILGSCLPKECRAIKWNCQLPTRTLLPLVIYFKSYIKWEENIFLLYTLCSWIYFLNPKCPGKAMVC